MADEITSLERRAAQVRATSSETGVRLAALAALREAATAAGDAEAVQKIRRKIEVQQRQADKVLSELKTLLTLIAARRSRYGLPKAPAETKPPAQAR